jgi:hypothetical protein
MRNKSIMSVAVVLLAMIVCLAAPQMALSSTIVTVEPGGTFIGIGGFQFTILTPSGTTASSFTKTLPNSDWISGSSPSSTIVAYFDSAGATNLPSGPIGSFAIDVTLGSFVFSDQMGSVIAANKYVVNHIGTNYTVSAVPIPAAVWLLGSGLIGLVGLRRRMRK